MNSVSSPAVPISKICTFGAHARTFRIAVRSSFALPRDVSSRMSTSSLSKSSARKGLAVTIPAATMSPPFASIRDSASRNNRFSAATKTRGLPLPQHTLPPACPASFSIPIFVLRSPFERLFFGLAQVPSNNFAARQHSWWDILRATPLIDLHRASRTAVAFESNLLFHFCNFPSVPGSVPTVSGSSNLPQNNNSTSLAVPATLRASPGLVLSLCSPFTLGLPTLFFFPISDLPYFFLSPSLPFLVLPYYYFFWRRPILSGYASAIGLVVVQGLHSLLN